MSIVDVLPLDVPVLAAAMGPTDIVAPGGGVMRVLELPPTRLLSVETVPSPKLFTTIDAYDAAESDSESD